MRKKKLVHIYYNTSGNSGLYLNPIKEALDNEFDQAFLVNYYYPLDCSSFYKWFFKYTEKNENNTNVKLLSHKRIRKIVRFAELKIANQKVMKYLKSVKPDAINYSLTNMPDALSFLRKIKSNLPNCNIIVTCHDVVPFQATNGIDYQGIYDLSDYLLVHTTNAIEILQNQYGVSTEKIMYHPFPLIDLSLISSLESTERVERNHPNFLFIGVMRKEKGVQTLVDAWEKLGSEFKARLHIAGFKPDNVSIDLHRIESFSNFKSTIKSLSDYEYLDAVRAADYVVFPYSQVGNSGVLSTVVSLGKVPITTKLPTFLESEYCLEELSCEPDNVDALAELLKKVSATYQEKYNDEVKYIMRKLSYNKKLFAQSTLVAYKKMLRIEE